MRSEAGRRDFLKSMVRPATGPMTLRENAHGQKVSLLGYGAMRLPTVDGSHANLQWGGSHAAIDRREVFAQVDWAIEHGVNFFDTSPAYCRGESEGVMGEALARHPREKWFISTKMSNFAPSTHPFAETEKMYRRSLELLRTDHLDYYHLHAVGMGGFDAFKARYLDNGALEFCVKERAAGRIRNLGFSYHGDRRAWDWLIERHETYRWDFALIQLNYVDWRHGHALNDRNLDAEYLYGELEKRNIPVLVMEPLQGGKLAQFNYAVAEKLAPIDPGATPAHWAMRFAGHHPRVLSVISGMTYREHLEENAATFSPMKPLSERELAALEAAAQALVETHTVPCNQCQYCMPCPYGLDIPSILGVLNRALAERRLPADPSDPAFAANRRRFLLDYELSVPEPLRRADRCTGCGRCLPHCPQQIDVPREILRVEDLVNALKSWKGDR